MVRTVNPQISSVLNREIRTRPESSQNGDGLSFNNSPPQGQRNVQTLPTERDIANQENIYTDSPPSYDSSSPMDQYSNSPAQPMDDEQTPLNTVASAARDLNSELISALPAVPPKPPLTGIDACIDRLIRNPILRQRTETLPDTLIFIDRLCLQNRDLEDQLQEHYSNRPILVERSKLEALNSPYFNKCLSGMYQTRKWKFLSDKVALHTLPPGIKYIINMTPNYEGQEAVEAIQDLSCPFGVLHWKKSHDRWNNSMSLVGGVDENDIDITSNATAMEYSLVRHVKSIERFMAALQGFNPQLDTAPKLYSTVMVSKAWGIQGQHPLTDYVARWLCDTEANSKFIEAYPEVVLEMADVLKCAPLCKDAFAILVGEAALDVALTRVSDNQKTVYERVRGDIEEDWLSRVQHARNSFADKIKSTFDALAGEDMEWVSSLRTVHDIQLKARLSKGEASQFNRFLALLKRFIRGSIYNFLCNDYENMTAAKDQLSSAGDDLYPREIEKNVWENLRAPERVFTNKFWQLLFGCYTARYHEPHYLNQAIIMSHHSSRGRSRICMEYTGGHLLESISVSSLIEALPNSSQGWKAASPAITKSVATKKTPARLVSFRPRAENVADNSDNFSMAFPQQEEASQDAVQANLMLTRNLTLPETPNDGSLGYALMFGNCSSSGCSNKYYSLSVSSFCDRCRRQYCVDHIDQDDHGCNLAHRDLTANERQRPFGTAPFQSAPTNQNYALQQTAEEEAANPQEQFTLSLIKDVLVSATQHISAVGRRMLSNVPGGNLGPVDDNSRITHTLTCLSDEELKYLPLWAEGLDDGTGGVFGDHIPSASEDSTSLGPGGRRLTSRSEGSSYSFVSEAVDSTVNTSTIAHDGYRDTLPRGRVVAMDDAESSSEGGWSYIQDTIGNGKGKARAFTPEQDSEIASTLGGLENASVIDLGIQSGTDSFDQLDSDMDVKSIGSSDVSSPRTIGGAQSHDDEVLDGYDDFDQEGLDDNDDDTDMMFDDELVPADTAKQASIVAEKTALSTIPQSIPTTDWHEHKSMAHVSYRYRNEADDDLMTRP